MLSFKEWLKHKDQLNAEKQRNRFKVHVGKASDHPNEITVNVPEIILQNHAVKTLKTVKGTSEQKDKNRGASLRELRESLQNYADQLAPMRSKKQTNPIAANS